MRVGLLATARKLQTTVYRGTRPTMTRHRNLQSAKPMKSLAITLRVHVHK